MDHSNRHSHDLAIAFVYGMCGTRTLNLLKKIFSLVLMSKPGSQLTLIDIESWKLTVCLSYRGLSQGGAVPLQVRLPPSRTFPSQRCCLWLLLRTAHFFFFFLFAGGADLMRIINHLCKIPSKPKFRPTRVGFESANTGESRAS